MDVYFKPRFQRVYAGGDCLRNRARECDIGTVVLLASPSDLDPENTTRAKPLVLNEKNFRGSWRVALRRWALSTRKSTTPGCYNEGWRTSNFDQLIEYRMRLASISLVHLCNKGFDTIQFFLTRYGG